MDVDRDFRVLRETLEDEEPLLRERAAWALGRESGPGR